MARAMRHPFPVELHMPARHYSIFTIIAVIATLACSSRESRENEPGMATSSYDSTTARSDSMSFRLTSNAFSHNGKIPSKYTCEGDDQSPALEWTDPPAGTKSFALIVDDPDAPDPAKPQRVYVHWVVYNIPADVKRIDENSWKGGMPAGSATGMNDFGKQGWGGPCPPIGRHRYFFKLYALDTTLSGLSSPKKKDVESAMKGHILGQAELMGTYQKGD
jgi:Raf kinase inhibitor-like YbhB/YbcL family protein